MKIEPLVTARKPTLEEWMALGEDNPYIFNTKRRTEMKIEPLVTARKPTLEEWMALGGEWMTLREHWGICDPNFIYHNSSDTDVQRTWRKFGWTPINEQEK
jgi:aryl carrier-like protein